MANLIKILQEQKDFSETEIMIATYLLANFRKLAGMSTRQLGKKYVYKFSCYCAF